MPFSPVSVSPRFRPHVLSFCVLILIAPLPYHPLSSFAFCLCAAAPLTYGVLTNVIPLFCVFIMVPQMS